MAAREVIHFPSGAQLSMSLQWPALSLPSRLRNPRHRPGPFHIRALNSPLVWAVRLWAKTELLNRGVPTMKGDLRAKLVLLNRNVNEMIRLVERATDARIWAPQEATRHVARLEFLRAKLNADFGELMALRERATESLLSTQNAQALGKK